MHQILCGHPSEPQIPSDVLFSMYRLRHRVFKEKLQWEVTSVNGMECDHFDALNPVYIVSRQPQGPVEGCWRLLPTTGPYMLSHTFPELLRGEPVPQDTATWELSRFAVDTGSGSDRAQAHLNLVTFDLLRTAFDYAVEQGIRSYVTVTSVAVERLMCSIGLPLRRFGDGKATRIGRVLSVACHIPINAATQRAVHLAAAQQAA